MVIIPRTSSDRCSGLIVDTRAGAGRSRAMWAAFGSAARPRRDGGNRPVAAVSTSWSATAGPGTNAAGKDVKTRSHKDFQSTIKLVFSRVFLQCICALSGFVLNAGKSVPAGHLKQIHPQTPASALCPSHTRPSALSAARSAGSRKAGSPQPPPPPDRTWITLPDGTGTLISLLFSFLGAVPGASSV